MKTAFADGGTNNCIQSGAIASTRQYANLHRVFLRGCNMDFPRARREPEDTTGTFTMARKD
jgi:hypothetical protein